MLMLLFSASPDLTRAASRAPIKRAKFSRLRVSRGFTSEADSRQPSRNFGFREGFWTSALCDEAHRQIAGHPRTHAREARNSNPLSSTTQSANSAVVPGLENSLQLPWVSGERPSLHLRLSEFARFEPLGTPVCLRPQNSVSRIGRWPGRHGSRAHRHVSGIDWGSH